MRRITALWSTRPPNEPTRVPIAAMNVLILMWSMVRTAGSTVGQVSISRRGKKVKLGSSRLVDRIATLVSGLAQVACGVTV